jgi:hypothetical protein
MVPAGANSNGYAGFKVATWAPPAFPHRRGVPSQISTRGVLAPVMTL